MRAALPIILVLLLQSGVLASDVWWLTSPPPVVFGHQVPKSWWDAAKRGAINHNTTPWRIIAAGAVEINVRKHGWYVGKVGRSRFNAPMGYSDTCRKSRGGRVPDVIIDSPELQMEWAAGLLCGNLSKRLGSYNEEPDKDNYRRDVESLANQLESEAKKIAFGW